MINIMISLCITMLNFGAFEPYVMQGSLKARFGTTYLEWDALGHNSELLKVH